MVNAISEALGNMITWTGSVVTAVLSGPLKELLPVFALFVAASLIMFAIRIIRGFTWGA